MQETKDFAENTQRILVRPKPRPDSPAAPTQAQQTASFYASAADEDEDLETLHSTWVIPLDETPGKGAAVIVVTAEDTKLWHHLATMFHFMLLFLVVSLHM